MKLEVPEHLRIQCPRYPEMCSSEHCFACFMEVLLGRIDALETQVERLRKHPVVNNNGQVVIQGTY